jgi:hypothetical protein
MLDYYNLVELFEVNIQEGNLKTCSYFFKFIYFGFKIYIYFFDYAKN